MSSILLYAYVGAMLVTGILAFVAIATTIAANRERAQYSTELRRRSTEADLEDARQRLQRVAEEVDSLEQRRSAAMAVIEKSEREQAWLSASEEKLQATFVQMRQQQEREAALQDLQRKLDSLEERRTQLHQTTLGLESERRKLDDEIHRLQAEHGRTTNEVADLAHQAEQLRSNRTAIASEISALEQRRSSMREESTQMAAKVAKETEELRRVRSEFATVSREHAQSTAQHAALVAQHKHLEEAIKDAEERFRRTSERIDTDVERAEDRFREIKERVERDIADVRSAAARHGVDGADSDDPLVQLWRPALRGKWLPQPLPKNTGEQDQLARVRDHLRASGLLFSDRLVTAFHTSLKVAQDSPLLVLAGISGTGKSLLPRRYAEGIGMHFLPVPVQPRWDGPQDLLGFFHHLHGTYFATELCRALVQMDRHSQSDQRGWAPSAEFEPLPDRMLLVLLDEMNLARVEYYFSEMISRLEMRRDIDPDNAAARALSEILIDAGPRREGQGDARIFVDQNVLFVGTMNEDESAQSLSDRVIDRANLIRFSRPTTFTAPAGTDKSSTLDRHLTYATWKTWLGSSDGRADLAELKPKVDQWVTTLNEGLARIGRPFGHRVRRSIYSYLQYYPETGPEALRLAMADQVEQRVLPKVRGIELGTSGAEALLDTIETICNELGDEELESAIREGRGEGHQFHWQGVTRVKEDDGA